MDLALSGGSGFPYSLNSGNGSISGFRVYPHGQLVTIDTVIGLHTSANRLVAR